MESDFWARCIEHHVVIVPFKAYRQYRDGNFDEQDFIGIKFVGLENEADGVLDDLYLSFETSVSGKVRTRYSDHPWSIDDPTTCIIGDTPEEALQKWIDWSAVWAESMPKFKT